MAMSWVDSCECYGTQDIEKIASRNNPEHPMLILLAHDGDNDFSNQLFFIILLFLNISFFFFPF